MAHIFSNNYLQAPTCHILKLFGEKKIIDEDKHDGTLHAFYLLLLNKLAIMLTTT